MACLSGIFMTAVLHALQVFFAAPFASSLLKKYILMFMKFLICERNGSNDFRESFRDCTTQHISTSQSYRTEGEKIVSVCFVVVSLLIARPHSSAIGDGDAPVS